jgi:predicted HAD superfamily phosphohydrolase YqeG
LKIKEWKNQFSVEQLSFEEVDFWKNAHHAFVERLNKARFGTIIFDFDGTLCSNSNRFDGLSEEISLHLNKILKKGFIIAIATGRGKSALKDLKEAIDPIYWENVIIAYYNGGIIGKLL